MISKRRSAFAATALFALAMTAGQGAHAQEPKKGGTLVYLEQQAHTSLYPPAGGFYPNGGILNQITDKLTYQNPETLEIEPWIAKSWEINADATQYTFHLRQGVTFSDGTALDAAAVAKNFDRFGLGNKELKHSVSEVVNNYDRSEVVDAYTVKFHFKAPSPGFLQATSVIGSGLVSPATLDLSLDELGDATKIVGSGAFTVSGEILGKETKLAARRDYDWAPPSLKHQGKALLDEISIVVVPEDGVRIGALLAGQAGFIRQIQAYDEPRVVEQNFVVHASSTRGVNDSLAFRPDNPLVADINVRRALVHATNSREIVDTLFNENYPQAKGVLASAAKGFVDLSEKLTFDEALAGKLLDDAGWKTGANGIRQKDGKELVLDTYESLNYAQNKQVLQLVAQQWLKVGVKFNVKAGDLGSKTVDSLDPAKTPLIPAMVGRADPDVIKSNYHPKNRNLLLQLGGASDKVKTFEDKKLNDLFNLIATEPDPEKRLSLTEDVQRYLVDQAYVIPLFEEPQIFAGAAYVKDVGFEAVGRPSFYATWLEQ
jgi:peptide/nickel transport system substrate-binding protein